MFTRDRISVGLKRISLVVLAMSGMPSFVLSGAEPNYPNARKPASDQELRDWLENMVWHHQFTTEEIQAATSLSDSDITAALKRFGIAPNTRPARKSESRLRVLPYPGGRHPRLGFLEGAIDP